MRELLEVMLLVADDDDMFCAVCRGVSERRRTAEEGFLDKEVAGIGEWAGGYSRCM